MVGSLRSERRRAVWGAGVAALLLLVGGCGLPEALTGGESGPGQGRDVPRQPPTALHPALRDCAPAGSDDALSLASADLDAVSWTTPEGFYDASEGYFEDNPVEDLRWQWVGASRALPAGTLDVISVNYYANVSWNEFADGCDSVPLEAIRERLGQYRVQIGAHEISDPEMIEINGYPAMKQDLRLENYDYEGYWLFSTSQLLHVYCQWENASAEKVIRTGCKDLVNSIVMP